MISPSSLTAVCTARSLSFICFFISQNLWIIPIKTKLSSQSLIFGFNLLLPCFFVVCFLVNICQLWLGKVLHCQYITESESSLIEIFRLIVSSIIVFYYINRLDKSILDKWLFIILKRSVIFNKINKLFFSISITVVIEINIQK